jgi:hypothetical protein
MINHRLYSTSFQNVTQGLPPYHNLVNTILTLITKIWSLQNDFELAMDWYRYRYRDKEVLVNQFIVKLRKVLGVYNNNAAKVKAANGN